MRKIYLFVLLSLSVCYLTDAQVFWTDNFETTAPSSGTRSAGAHTNTTDGTGPTGSCGASDYFYRTNIVDVGNGVGTTFTGFEGNFQWRGEDLVGCVQNPDVIDFTGINITGRTDLTFLGLFAARTATTFEGTDDILVEYQIDGGGYSTGIAFEPEITTQDLKVDTNNDGAGDGTSLTDAHAEFSFTISSTGTTLDLRITVNIDGGGEEFAFDNFRMSEIPLPVELTQFDATIVNKKHTLVQWETASEENNHYFDVEHSTNGRDFLPIGKVLGNGDSYEKINYTYTDRNPISGVNYYRLKQVDFDGAYEYSKIVSVEFRKDNTTVSVKPNPFQQELLVLFDVSEDNNSLSTKRTIEIFDVFGHQLHSFHIGKVETSTTIDLSHLASGTYVLRTRIGSENVTTQRIIKL